jgi:hypothetical protein
MNRLYNERGEVAVILNRDYGVGWSTAADYSIREEVLFCPFIAKLLTEFNRTWLQQTVEYCRDTWPDFYCSPESLEVYWVDRGREFIVREYDGYESLMFLDTIASYKA